MAHQDRMYFITRLGQDSLPNLRSRHYGPTSNTRDSLEYTILNGLEDVGPADRDTIVEAYVDAWSDMNVRDSDIDRALRNLTVDGSVHVRDK